MVHFNGGPADNTTLMLARAPLYLRVVRNPKGELDALDQVNDKPAEKEQLFAYERIGDVEGYAMVDFRGKGGRRQGFKTAIARYRYVERQPEEFQMRNNVTWQAWAREKYLERLRPTLWPPTETNRVV